MMKNLFLCLLFSLVTTFSFGQTDVTVTNSSGQDVLVELRAHNSACSSDLVDTETINDGDDGIVTAPGGTVPYLVHVYVVSDITDNNYETCSGTTCTVLSGGPGTLTITWTGCSSVLIE